jgi:hypothetical protein
MKFKHYLSNCFLLLIPLFLWNLLLIDLLPAYYAPEVFDNNIPNLIAYSENILRAVVFVLPAFMLLSFKTKRAKVGLVIYLIGLLCYFSSWLLVIIYPESNWSNSLIGFSAPAYTTIIWFVGIGLIGNKAYIKIPYLSVIYISVSIIFVVVHTWHTYIVYLGL